MKNVKKCLDSFFIAYFGDGHISLAYFTDHSHNINIYKYV